MIALLKAILLLPVALVVILLAIANRAPVTFSLDPTGGTDLAFPVPLYLILFATLALGVILGGVGTWLTAGRQRRRGRASRREVHRLKEETDRLRSNLATTQGTTLPATRRAA